MNIIHYNLAMSMRPLKFNWSNKHIIQSHSTIQSKYTFSRNHVIITDGSDPDIHSTILLTRENLYNNPSYSKAINKEYNNK